MKASNFEPKVGANARHKRTGGLYYVTDIGEMKIGDQWVPAVFYQSADGRKFSRELCKFKTNFEPAPTLSHNEKDVIERAQSLINYARHLGLTLEIETKSLQPPRIGNYQSVVSLRPTYTARKAAEEAARKQKEQEQMK